MAWNAWGGNVGRGVIRSLVIKKTDSQSGECACNRHFLNVFIVCLKFEGAINKLFSVMSKHLFASCRCFELLFAGRSICCLVFGGRLSKWEESFVRKY